MHNCLYLFHSRKFGHYLIRHYPAAWGKQTLSDVGSVIEFLIVLTIEYGSQYSLEHWTSLENVVWLPYKIQRSSYLYIRWILTFHPLQLELNHVRHTVADIYCLAKKLDLRLMLFTKKIIANIRVSRLSHNCLTYLLTQHVFFTVC